MNSTEILFIRTRILWLVGAFLVGLTVTEARADYDVVRLAASTSTANSGLMALLIPKFAEDTKRRIELTAVATGKALRLGRDGKVDVLLVHAPAAERQFVASGHGIKRVRVMHNDLIIVGPRADRAGIEKARDVIEAFRRIGDSKESFVSRADDSGTHRKEMTLWKGAGIQPYGLWYREVGKGMADALAIANRESSYLLIDRGTWLKHRSTVDLELLFEGDERLLNIYTAIAVNPAKHSQININGAQAFIDWIISPEITKMIASYRIDGEQLYIPHVRAAD
jgi:tungstate transport system substrate-binding protein